MDLLTKFDSVELTAEARISEKDRIFCKAHQAAYDSARTSLPELEFFWDDIKEQQNKALTPIGISPDTYLTVDGRLILTHEDILQQVSLLHPTFIYQLVSYFTKTYHFSIKVNDIIEALIPQKPAANREDGCEEQLKKYTLDLQCLTLCYTDILEQIFRQTEGRALSEQALYELKEKCRLASQAASNGSPRFNQKKSILQLIDCACSFQEQHSSGEWELSDWTKDILQGISHFETDSFDFMPDSLSRVLNKCNLPDNQYEFPDCEKIQSLRMFRTGFVALKFTSEAYACQFIEDYMKSRC